MDGLEQCNNKRQQTLDALDSVAKGRVIAAEKVHIWLNSWGTDNELEVPKLKTSTNMLKD